MLAVFIYLFSNIEHCFAIWLRTSANLLLLSDAASTRWHFYTQSCNWVVVNKSNLLQQFPPVFSLYPLFFLVFCGPTPNFFEMLLPPNWRPHFFHEIVKCLTFIIQWCFLCFIGLWDVKIVAQRLCGTGLWKPKRRQTKNILQLRTMLWTKPMCCYVQSTTWQTLPDGIWSITLLGKG